MPNNKNPKISPSIVSTRLKRHYIYFLNYIINLKTDVQWLKVFQKSG